MTVYCRNCGKQNDDPGGNLDGYSCGNCGHRALYRKEDDKAGTVMMSGVSAAIGAGLGGPIGAIIGAAIGYYIGSEVDKGKKT